MHSHDEVFASVRRTLVALFELDPGRLTLQSRLNEDLQIDSIDMVDLLEEVRRQTGRQVRPEDFRAVRTLDDLVAALVRLMNA